MQCASELWLCVVVTCFFYCNWYVAAAFFPKARVPSEFRCLSTQSTFFLTINDNGKRQTTVVVLLFIYESVSWLCFRRRRLCACSRWISTMRSCCCSFGSGCFSSLPSACWTASTGRLWCACIARGTSCDGFSDSTRSAPVTDSLRRSVPTARSFCTKYRWTLTSIRRGGFPIFSVYIILIYVDQIQAELFENY